VRAYRWCGLRLETNIEFPELAGAGAAPDGLAWHLSAAEGRAPRRAGRRWFHRWRTPDGKRWVAFSRDEAGYVLRFPEIGDFDVQPALRRIDSYAGPHTPPDTVRHLLLDQVLPLIAGAPDRLALHGSVVATGTGAIAFLGYSGLGKSTLAARLGRRGLPVLSDDCCLICRAPGGFEVVPSYPGVRLKPDAIEQAFGERRQGESVAHYSTKRRVGGRHDLPFSDQPVPLLRLYAIAPLDQLKSAGDVTIAPRTPRQALYDIIDYTFHLDIGFAPRIRETFVLAGDLVERHGVRGLVYPWHHGAIDRIVDTVLDDAAR
jgi:hypothetical protein